MSDINEVIKNKRTNLNPIWIMRQAGRYLPEFREIRKLNPNFINLCLDENLSSEITLQPLKRFNLDAAIIFSDILMLPYGLNQKVEFEKGFGPKLGEINIDEMSKLDEVDFVQKIYPVYKAIKKVRTNDVVKNKNIYIGSGFAGHMQKTNFYDYKSEFYKNIMPNMIPQIVGNTGFENLKKILAMETGVYNQFDVQYRFPQSDLVPEFIKNRKNFMTAPEQIADRMRNIQYSPEIKDLFLEYMDYIDKNDVQCVNKYNFEL